MKVTAKPRPGGLTFARGNNVRIVACWVVGACLLTVGCGGYGLPPEGSVVVTVTAARTPIATGETVQMSATISGYSGNLVVNWLMQQTYDRDKQTCSYKQGEEPSNPFANCPEGYLTYADVKVPMQSTYHAPPTAGTYSITFGVVMVPSLSETKYVSGTTSVVVN